MVDVGFLPELGVGWTAVGMMGTQEAGNAMARIFIIFILIVTTK